MFVCRWSKGAAASWSPQDGPGGAAPACGAAVATNDDGQVYVLDPTQLRVGKYSTSGELLLELEDDSLCLPAALAVSAAGASADGGDVVFVVDAADKSVLCFHVARDGSYRLRRTIRAGCLLSPSGAAALDGRLFVSDAEAHQVHVFAMATGAHERSFGRFGSGPGQFTCPSAVAANARTRELYVCDTGCDRVQVLSSEGHLLRAWGASGGGPGQLRGPRGVAVCPASGAVAVADCGNSRVQVFDGDTIGRLLWEVSSGTRAPCAVAFDPEGDLVVCDDGGAQWFAPPDNGDSDGDDPYADDALGASAGAESESEDRIDAASAFGASKPRAAEDSASEGYSEDSIEDGAGDSAAEREESYSEDSDDDEGDEHDEAFEEGDAIDEDRDGESSGAADGDDGRHSSYRGAATAPSSRLAGPPRRAPDENARVANAASHGPGNAAACKRRPGARPSAKSASARARLSKDMTALRDEVRALQSEKDHLASERDALRREREARKAVTARSRQGDVAQAARAPDAARSFAAAEIEAGRHVLDTPERVERCADALLLEERALELGILLKELRRGLPAMRAEVAAEEAAATRLECSAEQLRHRLARETKLLQQHQQQQQLAAAAREGTGLESSAESSAEREARQRGLEEEKRRLASELARAGDALQRLRGEAAEAEAAARAHASAAQPLAAAAAAACAELEALGGREAVVRAFFKQALPRGKHVLDAQAAAVALRRCAALEGAGRLAEVSEEELREYVEAGERRLDFRGFRAAVADLSAGSSSNR